ncbi:uncharacterized protein LOC106660780 [Cimex lectularius]|uniref:Transmembrane protein 135 N-terminal domain-containing protein n=1 Tax=Cimex lectularius TaxID=79782 RepID=A0A8I6R7Q3_CIMLE|nr:uncharacterized protein LOC106660780 [Cimex lectularius]
MTVFSKQHLDEISKIYSCRDMIHPWGSTCTKGNLIFFYSAVIGASKFFFVMYTFQYLFMYKKLTKNHIPVILKSFFRSMLMATMYAICFTAINCLNVKITGRLNFSVLKFWCPFISSFPIFLDHPVRRSIVTRTFVALAIECVFRRLYKRFQRSKNLEMLFFMICNAIFMYTIRLPVKKKSEISVMWFFKPSRIKDDDQNCKHFCSHRNTCWDDILKNTAKYFTIGLGFSTVKVLVKSPKLIQNPIKLVKTMLNWDNCRIAIFASSYVALYKIISCYLCNTNKKDDERFALISGFVSGVAYKLNPNLTLLSSLMTILLYMGGEETRKRFNLPNFCYEELAFIVSNTLLLSTRIIYPEDCPSSFIKIIDMGTNGRSDELYKNLRHKIEQMVVIK